MTTEQLLHSSPFERLILEECAGELQKLTSEKFGLTSSECAVTRQAENQIEGTYLIGYIEQFDEDGMCCEGNGYPVTGKFSLSLAHGLFAEDPAAVLVGAELELFVESYPTPEALHWKPEV